MDKEEIILKIEWDIEGLTPEKMIEGVRWYLKDLKGGFHTIIQLQSSQSEVVERTDINCNTCKHWGGQGTIGMVKTTNGKYRPCIAYLFGDMDNRDFKPMPEWKVTFGNLNGAKGILEVHENYACINHNGTFDVE